MARTVIIGAGLTGLSIAYHLEQLGYHDYILLESEATVGGLCRSVTVDGYTFDYTGHLLHINDPYFKDFITTQVGMDAFHPIARRSYVYSHQAYTPYPFQINLHGLPPDVIADCLVGYIERPRARTASKKFSRWVLQQFGAGMARHFFYPYQEKIFDIPVHELSSSWTGRFVPPTDLHKIVKGALEPAPILDNVGYNANFLYPRQGGIFYWINKLHQAVQAPVLTNHTVTAIDLADKSVICNNGQKIAYEHLISTMPLDRLLRVMTGSSRLWLDRAADRLRCNSVINFNLGIARPDVSDKHWIYFPEKQYPFYRIGFTHNFSRASAPAGHSLLYGEVAVLGKDRATQEQLVRDALMHTKKLFGLAAHEVTLEHIMHIGHAYVIFDAWRDRNLPRIHRELAQQGIQSVGRYGGWKYSSMQEGLLEGRQIAMELVDSTGTIARASFDRLRMSEKRDHQPPVTTPA